MDREMTHCGVDMPFRWAAGAKQLFCDWSLVEPGYGMPFWPDYQKHVGTRPWLSPRGVALRTYPLEVGEFIAGGDQTGQMGAYATLIAYEGRFRLYHERYPPGTSDLGARVGVLESDDLTGWSVPDGAALDGAPGIVFGAGGRATGGLTGGHGATVFLDPGGPEAERWKMVYLGRPLEGEATLPAWVYGAVSPDGLAWRMREEPLLKMVSDTQNVCWPVEGGYRLYARGWEPQFPTGGGGRRVVRLAGSGDFHRFGAVRTVLRPPAFWGPATDIYTSAVHPWPGAPGRWLMLPTLYDRSRDTTQVALAVSGDGEAWEFPSEAPVFSAANDMRRQTACVGVGIVEAGPLRWGMALHLSPKGHNEYRRRLRGLHLATIREDGFAGVEADLEGSFCTFPAELEGERLTLNGWTRPGGSVRVEVFRLGAHGEPVAVEGFSLEDCTPMTGDLGWEEVRWKGGGLSRLGQGPVRLRFDLVRARVFSFRPI